MQIDGYEIREASQDDVPEIREFIIEHGYELVCPQFEPTAHLAIRKSCEECAKLVAIRANTRRWLIARELVSRKIVATVSMRYDVPRGHFPGQTYRAMIANVLTHSDHRRRGLSRAMLLEMGAFAKSAGVHILDLHVRKTATAARTLYASLGFTESTGSVEHELRASLTL